MPKHLVISTSGNPDSNSRRMGRAAFVHLQKKEVDCDWIDIREMDLPLCDADKCYGMPGSKKLSATIESADGILIAAPVYNYDVAAATKNMIELTGSVWEDKIVGFLCAAGGHASYMSVMAYANSLMLDFRLRTSSPAVRARPQPPTLSTASASTTKKSPNESNRSPTNSFASPKALETKFTASN